MDGPWGRLGHLRSRRIDMDVRMLGQSEVLGSLGDVAHERERHRRRRIAQIAVVLGLLAAWCYWRLLSGNPVHLGWPHVTVPAGVPGYPPGLILVVALCGALIIPPLLPGRAPPVEDPPGEVP